VDVSEPVLRLERISKRFGEAIAASDLSIAIEAGEFFTLLGPSGSGKSSILRVIAGLERPDSGRVLIAGEDVSSVPPWRRNIGMVFQTYALFPHMNVASNVGYGLRMRRDPKPDVDCRVAQLLSLVGLAGKEAREVVTLSGGEQQRVALARALAVQPAILLLDEPLSALDEKIRREMQAELKHIQKQTGTTFVYVTHDQEEALTMSDRIAVVNHGVCAQCDPPESLFRRPRTRFVAGFFRGCNVLEAECIAIEDQFALLRLAGQEIRVSRDDRRATALTRVALAMRAEAPLVGEDAVDCPIVLQAAVIDVVYRGTSVDHVLELADGQRLLATATRRRVAASARTTRVGLDPGDFVLLED
jgi:ABC-type Fe3+/spermidine/putrescine transport system ATPase subunit